jgi:ATP-dependent DNA helicase RecG
MADLLRDRDLMTTARYMAQRVLEEDPSIELAVHKTLRVNLDRIKKDRPNWSRIS